MLADLIEGPHQEADLEFSLLEMSFGIVGWQVNGRNVLIGDSILQTNDLYRFDNMCACSQTLRDRQLQAAHAWSFVW
jgi:hypothetical protein